VGVRIKGIMQRTLTPNQPNPVVGTPCESLADCGPTGSLITYCSTKKSAPS
jgi:hypothetical protein